MRPLFLVVALLFGSVSLASADPFRNPRHIVTPLPPVSVLVLDLNGDGRPDLLYGTDEYTIQGDIVGGTLHPLFAQPDGSYLPGTSQALPANISTRCIAVDLNLDHIPDLVCPAYQNSNAAIGASFLGDGHGAFSLVALIPPPLPPATAGKTRGRSSATVTGDLNHDGFPDVVFTALEDPHIYSLLGDGTGHLTARVMPSSTLAVHATLSDLNGDGNLDLVLSPLLGFSATVLLGQGDGTFGAPFIFPNSLALADTTLGDFDGDGHLDLVSGIAGIPRIFHGNPDGSFDLNPILSDNIQDPANTMPVPGRGDYFGSIAVADLNHDGLPDILAIASDGLTVLLGQPGLHLAPPVHYPTTQDPLENAFFNRYAIADLNTDGNLDFVAAGPHGLWITYGRADGTFVTGNVYDSGLYLSTATLADFNEDGNPDMVTTGDTTLHLSLGRANGTFQPALTVPGTITYTLQDSSGYPYLPIVHGDFNGDHHQDLLSTGYPALKTYNHLLLFGHGDGTFTAPLPLDSANPGIPIPSQDAVADINRDGRDDFASLDSTGTISSWLSVGDGTFRRVQSPLPPAQFYNSLLLTDLNQDGIPDAVFLLLTEAKLVVMQGVGDGTFRDPIVLPAALPSDPYARLASTVTVGDFDGDGRTDIAVDAIYYGAALPRPVPAIAMYYNLGPATSGAIRLTQPVAGPLVSISFGGSMSADLNGDGRSDLIFSGDDDIVESTGATNFRAGEYIAIFHGLPNRTFGPEEDVVAGVDFSQLFFADLDHDGHPDIISAGSDGNHLTNAFTVLLSQTQPVPTGTLTATPEPSNATQPFSLLATLQPPASTPTAQLSGTATFAVDGTPIGSAPLAANAATLSGPTNLAPGTHQLTATVTSLTDGITTYPPLTLTGTHTVLGIPTQLSLAATPNPTTVGQTTQLTVSITNTPSVAPSAPAPTGTYTITDATTTLTSASVQSPTTTTTFQTPGTHTLTLTYSGDPNHAPSTGTTTLNVLPIATPTAFTLSLSPFALTIRGGQTATILVTVNRTGNGPLTLQLTSGSLPPKSTATFATPSLAFTGAATASSALAITTAALPPYLTQLHATPSPGRSSRPLLALLLTTPLLAFALRRQRHSLPTLLTALLLAGTLLSLAGCGESFVKATPTPATTYAIPVAATDPATGITSVAALSLTVTP